MNMYHDSIFLVETDKIKPNPYQPRRDFNEEKLRELAESIRQYGVLQPLIVTRQEVEKNDGGLQVFYELLAGERRLRASKIAGVFQVPVVIRTEGADNKMKLEIAIIENVQREDLSPIDRARAFRQLIDEFGFKHAEIAQKIGKSRVYVSNSTRLLGLPDEIIEALSKGKITEGHTRPLLMLEDKPEERSTLFKDILYRGLTVREAERFAREIAHERARKKVPMTDPELLALEEELASNLGTAVRIEKKDEGGKITIDFFSIEDVKALLDRLQGERQTSEEESMNVVQEENISLSEKEETQEDEDLYSVKNFTI